MFSDIKRICQQPTKEDKRWFPDIAGSPWLETLDYAMQNFRDESFISQFLSPKVIRDLKLFALHDDQAEAQMKVSAIHDDDGYRYIRERLAFHYNLANNDPDIEVWNVNVRGDRKLTLRYYPVDSRPLGSSSEEVLKHVRYLWGFDVCLETANDGKPAALETEQGTCE